MKKVLFVLLCFLCVSLSWGACRENTYSSASGFKTRPTGYHSVTCIQSAKDCSFCTQGTCASGWSSSYCQTFHDYCDNSSSLGGGCPSVYQSWPGYYTDPEEGCPFTTAACNNAASGCNYRIICDTEIEADSVVCESAGNSWEQISGVWQCVENPPCDSNHWECTTSVEHNQTTIANDNVQCFDGDCYGGVYCEYTSKSTTECQNDCGQFTTQEASSAPIRYEGHCNEDNLTDDSECTQVKCMSFEKTQSYTLYKLCASREIVNGERKFLPRIVGGGKGNCKNAGYPESNPDDFSGSDSSDTSSVYVPESCFTMGIGCPASDSSSYEDEENRTPDKCICQKYDGISTISQIVCPDGSRSIFYGSCHDWENPPSSSSVPPESSSSGSENPQSSSGGVYRQDWVTWSQGEEIKGLLSVIALNTAKEQQINNVNNVNVALDDYTTSINDSTPALVVPDSMYDPQYFIDTIGLADSIFKRVTEENTILDTLVSSGAACPCLTFFGSNGSQSSTANGHIKIQQIQFDFANFHGYNLCHIISVIVTGLASVVAFFIGFAIFKNVSQ